MAYDCARLIRNAGGAAYEHEYDAYLSFFRELAHAAPADVANCPPCWAPFVAYLGHAVQSTMQFFGDADLLDWRRAYDEAGDKRRVVEMASTARPELVHALYLYDTGWCSAASVDTLLAFKKQFVVTCNASFFRPEIMAYRDRLRAYQPTHNRAVLVPCAAAKPYPAPMHQAVLDRLPNADWDVIIVTGVLGLLPLALWGEAPQYDSGLPYLERVTQTVGWYFTKHQYNRLVVYSDFYAHSIARGLREAQLSTPATFMFGHHYRDTYENTMLAEHLDRLELELTKYSR